MKKRIELPLNQKNKCRKIEKEKKRKFILKMKWTPRNGCGQNWRCRGWVLDPRQVFVLLLQ